MQVSLRQYLPAMLMTEAAAPVTVVYACQWQSGKNAIIVIIIIIITVFGSSHALHYCDVCSHAPLTDAPLLTATVMLEL